MDLEKEKQNLTDEKNSNLATPSTANTQNYTENKVSSGAINEATGYGVASLVCGILAIVFLYFIIISILSAAISIIFGFTAMKKGDKGFGKAGLIMGTISILITFLLFLFLQVLDVSLFTIPSWYR